MGLEPTTFAVTGRCSNQLRYNSIYFSESGLKILPHFKIASHLLNFFAFFLAGEPHFKSHELQ